MSVSFGTYYINAETFSEATAIFTDAAMTIPAGDGTYQFGGIYKVLLNGVLQPLAEPCPSCCAPCSATYVYPMPPAKNRLHKVCGDVGSATNSAIIIKFKYTAVNNAGLGNPLGLYAVYDGVTYLGVESNRFGYLPAKYSGNTNAVIPADLVAESPYTLTDWSWTPFASAFQDLQTTTTETIALTDINISTSNPDECYMVIPKLSSISTIDVYVASPQLAAASPSGGCDITINCGTSLRPFTTSSGSGPVASAALACAESDRTVAYFLQVTSSGGVPRINDRVFSDSIGSTVLATGYYWINNTSANILASDNAWMRIGSNGVVEATGTCSTASYPQLTEARSSAMRNSAIEACEYPTLPDYTYWHNGTGDVPVATNVMYSDILGQAPLANGFYQLMKDKILVNITGGSGVVNSVIFCT